MEGLGDSLHGKVARGLLPPHSNTHTHTSRLALCPIAPCPSPHPTVHREWLGPPGSGWGLPLSRQSHAHTRSALGAGAKLRCMRRCTQGLLKHMVHVPSKRVLRWSVPSGRSSVMMELAAFSVCCFCIRLRGDFSVVNLVEISMAPRLAADSLRGWEAR